MDDVDRNLNATCEEYHSDQSDHVLESFRRSPNSANVAAKRSGGLGAEKVAEKGPINDLQSEISGYTSQTAATMNSTDTTSSGKTSGSKSTAPSSTASIPPSSPATTKRRPTLVTEERKHSSQNSPRKPLQRSGSVSSRRPAGTRRQTVEDCSDPTCTKCGPNALHSRGRRADSSLDYPSLDQRSQRSDPAPYTSPPSPTYSRQPAPYAQGPALVQPAQTHRRSSSTTRRPMSYHGDSVQGYWVPGMPAPYPSPPQEQHGPPPSMATRYMPQPQMPSYGMAGATPPQYYTPGQPMAQTPPYDHQRPPLSARGSAQSSYQTRPQGRPQSGYGQTLVTQERSEQPMPSARFHNAPQSATQERFSQAQLEYDSSEYDSSSEEEEVPLARNDRALMPPPKIKKSSKERRPSLRHANTTQVYNERRQSQSYVLPERTKGRESRASQVRTAVPSRAPSISRPALTQHATYDAPRSSQVVVENTSSRRRQSYQPGQSYDQVYDQTYDQAYDKDYLVEQKRRNRDSKIYREDAVLVSERERPRRRTDTAATRRSEYRVEDKGRRIVNDAEAYQQRMRGSNDPLTDANYKAAKRASRVPSDELRSNRSEDRKTRVSQAKTSVTNGGGNSEIRLRVDASAPLSLSFNGDMEGRTLQINPAEGGMADIVIGSSRDSESVYRSERGSTLGNRRPLIADSARRDAEEASVRSGRSSHGRRDGERRPLRRRTEYN